MDALPGDYATWEVPYLPIDPKHVGRTYEAIIRVNSQSGKGGVAYLMDTEHGLDLPRALQIEFSKQVQAVTEASGTEIKPGELWDVFTRTYLPDDAGIRFISSEVSSGEKGTSVVAQVLVDGFHRTISGQGNGPVAALVNGLRVELGLEVAVEDYHEHSLTAGSEASAVAYVQATGANGQQTWGVGIDSSILNASLEAVISAANRLRDPNVEGEGG
jgi:2-isopropylmalate synthase